MLNWRSMVSREIGMPMVNAIILRYGRLLCQPTQEENTKASVHPHYPLGGGGAGRDTEIIKLCLHHHNTYYTAPPL